MMSKSTIFRLRDLIIGAVVLFFLSLFVVPPCQMMRVADRRARNANNLKQLALAFQNYNDAYNGKLPPLADVGPNARLGIGIPSVFYLILPYVEAGPGYNRYLQTRNIATYCKHSSEFNYSGKYKDGSPFTVSGGEANQAFSVFVSPADTTCESRQDIPVRMSDGSTGYYAPTSYAVNAIVFSRNAIKIPESFKDGVANTILLGERPMACKTANGETIYNLWGYGSYGPQMPAFAALTPNEPAGMDSTGQAAPVLPLSESKLLGPLQFRVGRADAPAQTVNFERPFQITANMSKCDPRLPGTPHPSGMLVALADGSVRAINPRVCPWTFWAACTPDGNESLPADW